METIMNQIEHRITVAASDIRAAFISEARQAKREGMAGLSDRQIVTANHIDQAVKYFTAACPNNMRIEVEVVISYKPNINSIRGLGEYRERFLGGVEEYKVIVPDRRKDDE